MAEYLIGNIKGARGEPGFNPIVTVTQTSTGATISITDINGTTTANIRNGIDASGDIIDLSDYATKVELNEVADAIPSLEGYATQEYVNLVVPTKMSDLVNDTNFMVGGTYVSSINGLSGDVTLDFGTGEAFTETDPLFTASPAATISNEDITSWNNKQDALTAGTNITIENNVISATGGGSTYTAGTGIDITNSEISVDTTTVAMKSDIPAAELPSITVGDAGKVLKVNSGETGVEWGTVSGGTTYTAGNGINIVGTTISADTLVMATKTDLTYKQNNLTAGSNITLVNGVISATDTTYTAGTGIDITNGVISLSLAQAESESF